MERHAPRVLAAHGGTISVSTSWVHQFVDQKLNWSFWAAQTSQRPARRTAKAASNEGASTTTGRRHGSPPSSKNKPRICPAVMHMAKVQAKAKA
eukprot:366019-Chlamydomonas_euryale.AAC.1